MRPVYGNPRSRRAHRIASAFLLVGVGALLASGCATRSTGPMPETPQAVPYRIGPSDELVVRVLPDPAIERTVVVQPDGSFAFDLVGEVNATSRTPAEVAAEIEERISEYRVSPSVTVSLARAASSSVTVIGEVRNPGMYPVERDLRITDVIARASGETVFAAASRARLMRRESGTDTVHLYEANLDEIHGGDLSTDFLVLRGDLIYVPPATTVEIGYHMQRFLFPLEVLFRILLAPFFFLD
jgi:polysaccharide export outer membrane protein